MVYFLYGEDSYRRRKKYESISDQYRKKYGTFDFLDVWSDEDGCEARVYEFISQHSMFALSKALFLKGEVSCMEDEKRWVGVLKNACNSKTEFIVISSEKKPPAKFSFLLKDPVVSQEFPALSGALLRAAILEEAKVLGVKLTETDMKKCITHLEREDAGNRGWLIKNILTSHMLRSAIGKTDIALSFPPLHRDDARVRIQEIARGDVSRRLLALQSLMADGEAMPYVFNSLGYMMTGDALSLLADLDVSIKSGGLEYEEALLSLALR